MIWLVPSAMLNIATYNTKKIILVTKDATRTSQISGTESYYTNVKNVLQVLRLIMILMILMIFLYHFFGLIMFGLIYLVA